MNFFRDLFRPKAPPPDERPAGRFPHVFVTPRAARDIAAYQRKRGGTACVLVVKQPDGEFGYLVTPYSNLEPKDLVRVDCDTVPAYIQRGSEHDVSALVIDHPPAALDKPGQRTPNRALCMPLPWPQGAVASDPGWIRLSFEKLARLHPELLLEAAAEDVIDPIGLLAYQLLFGDTNPAIVAATKPHLLVCVYSGDIDCVVPLRFGAELAVAYGLKPGSRLVSMNSYRDDPEIAPDLTPGPKYSNWTNYHPMIAEFLADDAQRLAELHESMPEWSWQRCREMTVALVKSGNVRPRDGRPLRSVKPVGE